MPKTKKELTNALLKWLYGIEVLDEYRYQQAAQIGNTCFLIYFFGSMLAMLLSVGLMRSKVNWAMDFLLLFHVGLLLVSIFYMTHQSRKLGLLVVEVLPEDYEAEKNRRLKRHRKNMLFYFVSYTLYSSFMDHGFQLPDLLADLIRPAKLINSLILTAILYAVIKHQTLKNIRILTEETN